MTGSPTDDPDRRAVARSWYTTAATAGVVAALALITGIENSSIRVAGMILLAVIAVIAVTEGSRKTRRVEPSRLRVGVVAVLTTAAALLCLFGLASGGLLR